MSRWLAFTYRVATASVAMARSSMLATSATGGLVQSSVIVAPTTATWTTTTPMPSATTSISRSAFVYVALGIRLFGYLQWVFSTHCIICLFICAQRLFFLRLWVY